MSDPPSFLIPIHDAISQIFAKHRLSTYSNLSVIISGCVLPNFGTPMAHGVYISMRSQLSRLQLGMGQNPGTPPPGEPQVIAGIYGCE